MIERPTCQGVVVTSKNEDTATMTSQYRSISGNSSVSSNGSVNSDNKIKHQRRRRRYLFPLVGLCTISIAIVNVTYLTKALNETETNQFRHSDFRKGHEHRSHLQLLKRNYDQQFHRRQSATRRTKEHRFGRSNRKKGTKLERQTAIGNDYDDKKYNEIPAIMVPQDRLPSAAGNDVADPKLMGAHPNPLPWNKGWIWSPNQPQTPRLQAPIHQVHEQPQQNQKSVSSPFHLHNRKTLQGQSSQQQVQIPQLPQQYALQQAYHFAAIPHGQVAASVSQTASIRSQQQTPQFRSYYPQHLPQVLPNNPHQQQPTIEDRQAVASRLRGFKTKSQRTRGPDPHILAAAKRDYNHSIAGLNCEPFGGPPNHVAAEMVYWSDIPSDATFTSPFAYSTGEPQYLTFEPDEGGWNNIRMSMETAVAMAHAMGRILVLPPTQAFYLLGNDKQNKSNNRFTFKDFFHLDSIANEHPAVEIITMDEFLERQAMTGKLRNKSTGNVEFPPNNLTQWDGMPSRGSPLWPYLRSVASNPIWNYDTCVVAFPSGGPGKEGVDRMRALARNMPKGKPSSYFGNPTPVDASPRDRLQELIGDRRKLCIYDEDLQQAPVIHLMGDDASGARLLVHFYAFLFFEDWRQDLWTKRFVRDHARYIDEIQCSAARIVAAVREVAAQNSKEGYNPTGQFDTFHIRRGDFQYSHVKVNATEIYNNVQDVLEEGSTIYIATDEKEKSFFDPLREHYHLLFLDDFLHLVPDLNVNMYGMLDQLIASRGRTFVGVFFSTFTGYINRIRGYHSQKSHWPGYESGGLESYYYAEPRYKYDVRIYQGIRSPMWAREFPVGWRDIDHDVDAEAVLAR